MRKQNTKYLRFPLAGSCIDYGVTEWQVRNMLHISLGINILHAPKFAWNLFYLNHLRTTY